MSHQITNWIEQKDIADIRLLLSYKNGNCRCFNLTVNWEFLKVYVAKLFEMVFSGANPSLYHCWIQLNTTVPFFKEALKCYYQ